MSPAFCLLLYNEGFFPFPLHFRMIRCSAWSCSSGCQETTWLKTLCIEWAKPVAIPPGPPERFCATATTWRQVSRACPNGHVYSRACRTACIIDLSRATTVQCFISSATQRRGLDYQFHSPLQNAHRRTLEVRNFGLFSMHLRRWVDRLRTGPWFPIVWEGEMHRE